MDQAVLGASAGRRPRGDDAHREGSSGERHRTQSPDELDAAISVSRTVSCSATSIARGIG